MRRTWSMLGGLALAVAACAPDDQAIPTTTAAGPVIVTTTTTAPEGDTAGPATVTARPATVAPPAVTTPVSIVSTSTTAAPPDPDVVPVVATEPVGTFDSPVDLAVRPGDPAAYVVEQAGRVVYVDLASGGATPVLDVTDLTDGDGERGLLGLAFHPYEPFAYVNYTTADGGDTVIAEFAVAPDGQFDVGSRRELLTVDQPYANHNGGDLEFGPEGGLYIGLGDGGSGGDPERRAGDPDELLGKLLRIDPRGDPYTVPADNPYAAGGGAPEVWALGLRNPWKFAFDPPTGELWIADVGQNSTEEVDVVAAAGAAGANFGWSGYEGTERYNDDVADPGNLVMPVLTYSHAEGCSISGGVVYRGTAVPALQGWYVYADYCSGTVWALDAAGGRNVVLLEGLSQVTAVRTGPDGEAYVLQQTGAILRLTPPTP